MSDLRVAASAISGVLCAAALATAVMQTLLLAMYAEIPGLLHVTIDDASWLLTATLLVGAVATPSLSRLADMYGKRRMILVCLSALLVGSLVGVIAPSLPLLIAARALQGASLAIVPIGMSLMRDELPSERLSGAVALMSAAIAVGAALGLSLTGLIYLRLGWHALFWICAAMGAVLIVAVLAVVPESPVRSGGSFDLLGAVLLSMFLTALLLGITKSGVWGWSSPAILLSFGTAAVMFVVWLRWELRARHPLVDLRVAMHRPVIVTNAATVIFGLAMFVNLLATSALLQMPTTTGYGVGLTVVQAGFAMLPTAVAMVVLAPVAGRLTGRYGPRFTLILASVTFFLGYALRAGFSNSALQISLGAVVCGCANLLAFSALPVSIMRSVPVSQTSAANGVNTVARYFGMASASAAVAAVLAAASVPVGDRLLPTQDAFQHVFVLAALAGAAAGIITLFLPRAGSRPAVSEDVVEGVLVTDI